MARALDAADPAPPSALLPASRPAPTPPVVLRPRRLSVTRIEEWVRDPYATYARFILGLEALARPDERVDARLRGTAIHAALEQFAEAWPTLDTATASETFVGLYLDRLRDGGMPDAGLARDREQDAVAAAGVGDERAVRFDLQERVRGDGAGELDQDGAVVACHGRGGDLKAISGNGEDEAVRDVGCGVDDDGFVGAIELVEEAFFASEAGGGYKRDDGIDAAVE
jgi:hypothetical protein